MKRATPLLYVIVTATLLVMNGCSEDGESSPRAAKTPVDGSSVDGTKEVASDGASTMVKIIDTDFRPVTATVEKGSAVTWKQVGDQPHSVTASDDSFDSSPDCGPIDSDRCLGQGDMFTHVFDEAGEFTYYCRVHGLPDGTGMTGTIVVK